MQNLFANRKKGFSYSVAGVVISLITLIVYAAIYGGGTRSGQNMSWEAVWLLLAGIGISIVFAFLKKDRLIPAVMSLFHYAASLFFLYAMYPYISAAFVGIDSTWEVAFFITLFLFILGIVVNLIAYSKASLVESRWLRISVPLAAILLGILFLGTNIANENTAQINSALGISTFQMVEAEESEDGADSEYFPSKFDNLEELIAAGRELGERAMGEGVVLLKNENNALPMTSGERSVSLFSISTVDPAYGGTGSGHIDVSTAPTFKQAFERNNLFDVNDPLSVWYDAPEQEEYKRQTGTTGRGVKGIRVIGEAPWDVVESANGSSFAQYGDAAIVVFGRLGGEGSDIPRGTRSLNQLSDVDGSQGDTTDGDYLKLSPKEMDLLRGLKQQKDEGVFNRIIVLLNTANQIEAEFIDNEEFGIDAALWIGTPGQTGLYAVADILAGNVNPSGRLSTSFWKTHDQNPVLANFGTFAYEGVPDPITSEGAPSQNKHYVVYQEGIYLGYKYTETRYEDFVMDVPNTGNYDYADTISYPFGFGESYSDFSYSNYSVEKSGSGSDTSYVVQVDVTNNGPLPGKEVVQVYLQKPYDDYNREHGVEAAAVELVGFDKTQMLSVNETETISISVEERQFASYDSYGAETYVLTPGDYYLTAARDAHAAVNNILAAKGYTPSNTDGRMDAEGQTELVSSAFGYDLDTEVYSRSAATGAAITNLFDDVDFNNYENRGDDYVNYTTRSDWEGTTPGSWDDTVVLHWRDQIDVDMDRLGRQGEFTIPEVDMDYPLYETYAQTDDGEEIQLNLIDLRVDSEGRKIAYNDPLWSQLLDQISWDEQAEVITYGMRRSGQIDSVNKPEALDHNGPSGLTMPYNTGPNGYATRTDDPLKESTPMAYPSGGILAASFNIDLMYEIGDLIGEDALWAGYNGLYGPGSNIYRTPYSGRNFEYYSEDGFLSGTISAYEIAAMESHGLYVYNKHIGLNDQEDLRRGINTWANEQSIREIYMRAFELPITIEGTEYEYNGETKVLDGGSGVMLAFNRMGLEWAGAHKGLNTYFLRDELGMDGIIVTDMWWGEMSPYMNLPALLLSGGDLVDGYQPVEHLEPARPGNRHADVAWAMRDSIHRILYTVVHSNAMNGISSTTTMVRVSPWWQTLLVWLSVAVGVLLAASLVLTVKQEMRAQGRIE